VARSSLWMRLRAIESRMPAAHTPQIAIIIRTVVDPNPKLGGPPVYAQPSANFERLQAAAIGAWRHDGIVREIVVHGDGETCTPPAIGDLAG
jgi:hypothetical protein